MKAMKLLQIWIWDMCPDEAGLLLKGKQQMNYFNKPCNVQRWTTPEKRSKNEIKEFLVNISIQIVVCILVLRKLEMLFLHIKKLRIEHLGK
ncbi:hypothetical protein NQ318_022200 [Aromia moschata]|uniref:Uncharacterized protein n=1 Tax=Aromia moschata TaxID=1265417 RepID=A0AAV8Z7I7_9CUCU|nr:hypothetical protein NQ318_022200 [Aromia moschata]